MDFVSLPPEINSGRMYAGAGAAPLLDAAAAWGGLAANLAEAAAMITSQVTGLAGAWIGPSATAMTAAATAYVSWLTTTAEQAAQTAAQATAAASAYETAFAATVPPPVIAVNRAQLLTLIATNFLGINTAAIMATEAQYAEMWAQDVTAMVGYQAQSAAATSALPQFTQAPQVTNPAGLAAQAAGGAGMGDIISQFMGGQTLPAWLGTTFQSFVSSGPYMFPASILQLFTVLWAVSNPNSSLGQAITNRIAGGGSFVLPEIAIPASPATPAPSSKFEAIRAGIADGERLGGRLSVPPSWAQQRESEHRTPGVTPVATADTSMSGLAGIGGVGGLGGLAGMKGTPTKQDRPVPQYGMAPTVMPKHPYGG